MRSAWAKAPIPEKEKKKEKRKKKRKKEKKKKSEKKSEKEGGAQGQSVRVLKTENKKKHR